MQPPATEAMWRRWLHRGEVLLLFDGLDEFSNRYQGDQQLLKTSLRDFPGCAVVLTCRTIDFEQYRATCPEWPVFVFSGLDDDRRNAYVRAYGEISGTGFDAQLLIDELGRQPALRPLAANPLLLSIICFVVDGPDKMMLPATRGELYDRAIAKLLVYREDRQRIDVRYPSEPPGVTEKRAVLEITALHLFAQSGPAVMFDEKTLGEGLRRGLEFAAYGVSSAPWSNALREDLVHNSGLLRGDAEQGYSFLHLTVHEFLAASALARVIDEKSRGWESVLQLADRDRAVGELVDAKAWDPRWIEVITLLAGRLSDPGPLLDRLSNPAPTPTNPTGDDEFRHRLNVAAMCLAEIPKARRDALAGASMRSRRRILGFGGSSRVPVISSGWPDAPYTWPEGYRPWRLSTENISNVACSTTSLPRCAPTSLPGNSTKCLRRWERPRSHRFSLNASANCSTTRIRTSVSKQRG